MKAAAVKQQERLPRLSGSLACKSQARWSTFYVAPEDHGEPLTAGALGQPGLWKRVVNDGGVIAEFDVPVPSAEKDSEIGDWALQSLEGRVPSHWEPPSPQELEVWVAPARLSVRFGSFTAQGVFSLAPARFALVCRVIEESLLRDLSAVRQELLHRILDQAHRRFRMVRVGISSEGSVQAEVDLSGAPRAFWESVIPISADALQLVVDWMAPSILATIDPGVSLFESLKVNPFNHLEFAHERHRS